MMRLFASPTFARIEKSGTASTSLRASALPPFTPKTTMPPAPSGRYFFASSGSVSDG